MQKKEENGKKFHPKPLIVVQSDNHLLLGIQTPQALGLKPVWGWNIMQPGELYVVVLGLLSLVKPLNQKDAENALCLQRLLTNTLRLHNSY